MNTNLPYITVLVTAPNDKTARHIASFLLDKKLIACANIFPVSSIYRWQGEVCEDSEVCLLMKTKADLFEQKIIPTIKEIHPYEEPEIIALPIIMGSSSYLAWINENCITL